MPPVRRERWLVALALLGLLALFFEDPLRRFPDGAWSTADLTQASAFTRVVEGHTPANRLLSDPPFQMQPWLHFALEELRAGRLPLWNPHNGGGQPLLANYQSSLLSPWNLPFLVLPFGMALWVSAGLKLFALGLFTYLLLREWRLQPLAAFLGAVAFAFSGHNVFTLAYPHPGALIVLPAGLFCFERALGRWKASRLGAAGPRAHWPWLVGLALACGVGALAGHPEPFFFAGLCLAAWVLVRILHLCWKERRRRGEFFAALRLGLGVLAAALLGTALAAVQILPFIEYLEHSAAIKARKHNQEAFLLEQWPLLAYPDLYGNPSKSVWPLFTLPVPNYEGANMLYPGALALLLALLGLIAGQARRLALALLTGLSVWFLYAYDIAGVAAWSRSVPLLKDAPINRSQPAALFAVACLAALGLDGLLRAGAEAGRARRLGLAATTALCALALWWTLRNGATALFERHLSELGAPESIRSFSSAHRGKIDRSLLLGGLALAALPLLPRRLPRSLLACAAVLGLFYQLGWIHRHYNPTIDERLFYPRTPPIERLADATKGELVAVLGDVPIMAETNLVHRVSMLANYDAMAVADHDMALILCFDPAEMAKNPRATTGAGLELFGARYVLAPGHWPLVDSEYARVLRQRSLGGKPRRLVAGTEFVQTLRASRPGLQAAMVTLLFPTNLEGAVEVVLEEVGSGRELARERFDARRLGDGALPPKAIAPGLPAPGDCLAREVVLSFPPEPDSAGKSYRLRCSGESGDFRRAAALVELALAPDPKRPGDPAPLLAGGEPLAGMARADLSCGYGELEFLGQLSTQTLWRHRPNLGRYYTVDGWKHLPDRRSLQVALLEGRFEPYEQALFLPGEGPQTDSAPSQGPAGAARVLAELPNRVDLEVERDRPGLLIVARSHFPGWRARIDGKEAPLWRANYAFSALAVPAGRSRIVLSYEPGSLRLGAALSLGAALLLGLGAWHGRRGAKAWSG